MKVIILCAGYATRLYPLTLHKAKPLLEVKGKPIVEHLVDQLVTLPSVFKIQIVTNDKFYEDFLQWRAWYGYEQFIEILNDGSKNEKDRRGAIGDLFFALDSDPEPDDLLIIAGDNYFDFNLSYFVLFSSLQREPVIAVHNVGSKTLASQYGIVDVSDHGKVMWFEEKPKEPQSTLASIGLYYLPLEHQKMISKYKEQNLPMDQIGYFVKWLSENMFVRAYPILGNWYDIGDHKTLEALQGGKSYFSKN